MLVALLERPMTEHRRAFISAIAMLFALPTAACGAAPEAAETIDSVSQALDDEPLPPNGTACYVDGPHVDKADRPAKGKLENGSCCVNQNCYSCTSYYECQVGGAKPAVRTQAGDGTWLATDVIVEPPPPPPPPPPAYWGGPDTYEP